MSFNYITKEDKTKDLFYKIPKQFMLEEKYKKMKDSAKILYSILYERTNLSIENNWFDDKDRAYIICTFDEIQTFFGCSRDKVNNALKDLEKFDLIKKDKITGHNGDNVNVLYVAHVETTNDTLKTLIEKHQSDYHKLNNKNKEYKREYNKKQSELKKAKRESKIVESENQTTIANTVFPKIKRVKPSNSNGSLKIRLRAVRKSDYRKTDFSKTESLVVVCDSPQSEKDYSPRIENEFYDIQKDSSISTFVKVNQLSSKTYMTQDTISVIHKFIDYKILLSENQIKMLNDMSRSAIEKAIETTVAQGGKSFSYFLKVYKSKEKEEIEDLMDDIIFRPSFQYKS